MNWEICSVAGTPGTWVTATNPPDENAGVITIRNGHRINIELNQSADQLVVASGGTLRIINNQVLTVKSGSGDDLDIKSGGTLQLFGNIYTESSTTVQISGTYYDLENCQIQGLGAVTLASGATCNTKNAYGIYLYGETIRGCFAVSDRTMSDGANYIFSSTVDPQEIYALPSTVNNLTASNSGVDESLVKLRTALAANVVTITSGELTLGGNTSLNTLTLNGYPLNFATYYVYFNNQHFSIGGKTQNVTALTVAEDVVTTYDLGEPYGTSIPRTWTTSGTQSGALNIILHYPEELTSSSRVNVWTRDTGSTTWTLLGKYAPSTSNGMHHVLIPNLASINNSTEDGTLEWTISEEEPTTPVELSSFTAIQNSENYAQINWITQSETGALGYSIYRGTDNNLSNSEIVSPLIPATNSSQETAYHYVDVDLSGFGTYYYWLEQKDLSGESKFNGPISITLVDNSGAVAPIIPIVTGLDRAYPNPFNPATTITYHLAKSETVKISIYNLRGELIRNIISASKQAGTYRVRWNGADNNGNSQPTGVYYVRMQAGKFNYVQKVVMVK